MTCDRLNNIMCDAKKDVVVNKEEWNVTITSPFYLGSGDQPGNMITHVIFTGDNYVAWARAMTLSLRVRRKYDFIEGTIIKPIEPMVVLDWDIVHSMIISWILRSMDTKIVGTIPMHENASDLWLYLERRFSVANGPRIHQLKTDISECKQTSSMTVDEYYSKLLGYYDELARLKPLPSYECHKCDCGLGAKLARDRDEEIFR